VHPLPVEEHWSSLGVRLKTQEFLMGIVKKQQNSLGIICPILKEFFRIEEKFHGILAVERNLCV